MALSGSNDNEKIRALCALTHKEQAVWFLNAFWDSFGQAAAEKVWQCEHKMEELDPNRAQGSAIDELNAHRFLEFFKETLTVQELRSKLREVGAIGPQERPKLVPLIHYLLFSYSPQADWHTLVNAPQGDNKEEIAEAQRMLEAVQAAFAESEAKAVEAAAALREAEKREAEAHKTEQDAKSREADAKTAKEELAAALADLKTQEEAYARKTEDLKKKTTEGGVVSQNKAKAELAQHLAEDPLPLRKAKITQEAAVKKAERTAQAATEARTAAEKATKQAIQARADSEQAKQAAEAAVEEARKKVEEAEQYLEAVKRKPGVAQGALWWISQELEAARAYLPEKKGGVRKKAI